MPQEDEGDEDPGNEAGIHQVTLLPAIPGNEVRTHRREEEGPYPRASQGEAGGKPASACKPPGQQRDMGMNPRAVNPVPTMTP